MASINSTDRDYALNLVEQTHICAVHRTENNNVRFEYIIPKEIAFAKEYNTSEKVVNFYKQFLNERLDKAAKDPESDKGVKEFLKAQKDLAEQFRNRNKGKKEGKKGV